MDVHDRPDDFVSTEWLAAHVDDPRVRIIDVRAHLDTDRRNLAYDDYTAEHIPGAVWFDVGSGHGELSDPSSPLNWTWPSLDRIERSMRRVGVGQGTTVVIVGRTFTLPYGDGTMWCTRTWWTLHHSGVDCVILAGGMERWLDEGRPVDAGDVSFPPGDFVGADRRHEAIADRSDVEEALTSTSSCVIDALPEVSFRGERVASSRPGHITGAQNLPFRRFIAAPTADLVADDEARAVFDRAGVFDRERAVLY